MTVDDDPVTIPVRKTFNGLDVETILTVFPCWKACEELTVIEE
jgi:hypothetical protein